MTSFQCNLVILYRLFYLQLTLPYPSIFNCTIGNVISVQEKEWLKKYQELSAELLTLQNIGDSPVPHKQAELEELVIEQDKANSLLRDNIFKLRQEIRFFFSFNPHTL